MLISLHGYDVFLTDELYPDYRGVLCELSERADVLFTTPSTFLKQKFCSITEIPQDKVIVIPNSFDSAVFKENFIPLHNSQELKISNVGRFVDWKSQHILVRAASHLKKMGISNFSIDFVGDGPELSACKALAEELDVCNECNFWGSVPHSRVAAIVGGSHIYVHTATSNRKGQTETFGVAILEAVAMLKPVVYLDYGGIKEIFENDFSGLYLSSGSGAAELAGCISQTVSELQNLEARMVKNTALKILGKFEEDVVFHKIIETYTRLVIN
jgi:glycosyltransferase involved in cell wall biosynthesis